VTPLFERLAVRPPRRVLVVQTAYLGDTVFTSALVAALVDRFPSARVELCVAPRASDVARAIPGAAQVHLFDKRGVDRGLFGLRRVAARLRDAGAIDLAVVPHRSPRSALLAFLSGAAERVGFGGTLASLLYTAKVAQPAGGFLEQEAALARAVGAAPRAMRLVAPAQHVAAARGLLGDAPLAALCVGSEWETKIWPPERLAALADGLAARGLLPVLLGGPREKPLARAVAAAMRARAVDTAGNSVAEALGILSLASLCVGGDTGLVHAARALGVPTVALFGPTSAAVHAFGPRERAVSLGLECSPCGAHGARVCPLGHHRCMRELDEARVLAACESVLGLVALGAAR
jgi:heptosyltransferase-2